MFGFPKANPYTKHDVKSGLRSKLVHGLAFGTPKFYIVPNDKINYGLVNLNYICGVKLGLRLECISLGSHLYHKNWLIVHCALITGWERTVHVSRCPALYNGRIFVPLCRELIIFVF